MAEHVQCTRCGGENPAEARFCIDCGATLISATTGPTTRLATIACPGCGASNPAEARFCVICGRTLGSVPMARPSMPPRPATHQAQRPAHPAQQSFPRTATPPTLTPFRPAPPRARPHIQRGQNPAPLIFLIGVIVLIVNNMFWPGVLVLIGISMLIGQSSRGHFDKGMSGLFWLGGLALLFATGTFWPGIFVLLILSAVINNKGWHW